MKMSSSEEDIIMENDVIEHYKVNTIYISALAKAFYENI